MRKISAILDFLYIISLVRYIVNANAGGATFKFVVICSFFALNGKINYANIVNDVNKTC